MAAFESTHYHVHSFYFSNPENDSVQERSVNPKMKCFSKPLIMHSLD